jgi:flagellar motility protein MotE (MotC chaperone)
MKSHLKVKGTENAVCLRSQRHPTKDIAKLAQQIGSASPEQLSTEKFCAAHLATLCQAAEKEIVDARGIGRLVNYAELPNILIEDIIPFHFLKQKSLLSTETTERIIKVNEKYSKGRDTNKDWAEDSEQKEATAWDEMKDASKEYLYPVYERMEALRLQK